MSRFEDRLNLLAPAPASDALRARLALPSPRRRLWTRAIPLAGAAAGLIAALSFALLKAPPRTPSVLNDAEKEFRAMEETLLRVKSIRVKFKRVAELATPKGGFEKVETKGELLLKQGNRLNMTCVHTSAPGQPFSVTTTFSYLCDGVDSSSNIKSTKGMTSMKNAAVRPKDLHEKMLLALARQSLAVPETMFSLDLADLKSSLDVAEFSYGTDETGRRVLCYRVGAFDAKLWTDPITGLPHKREYSRKGFGSFVETYECEPNPEFADALFAVPADK